MAARSKGTEPRSSEGPTEWGVTPVLVMIRTPTRSTFSGQARPAVDHVVVVDVSGSMSADLPALRAGLVAKLDSLVGPDDTVSLCWFSGAGEHGILLEGFSVPTLREREKVRGLCERWLRPVGLTGFLGGLNDAMLAAGRMTRQASSSARRRSLLFMSDGHDNQHPREEILLAAREARSLFQAVTVVEHGYMADRELLRGMAREAGGQLVFSEDLPVFEPILERHLGKEVVPEVSVPMGKALGVVGELTVALVGTELLILPVVMSAFPSVRAPATAGEIWHLAARPPGSGALSLRSSATYMAVRGLNVNASNDDAAAVEAAYGLASALSLRSKPDAVDALLAELGDVGMIRQFSGAFGKQQQSSFASRARAAALGGPRLEAGHDPKFRPPEDQGTVLDVLDLLAKDEGCRLLLDDPSWKYSRIGRGRQEDDVSTAIEAAAAALSQELERERDPARRQELTGLIALVAERRRAPVKFEPDPMPLGVPVSSLTWNEETPNVSVLVRREGIVDVSARAKGTLFEGKLGVIKTCIWRNYAIIRDGLVNMEVLPLLVSPAAHTKLMGLGVEGRSSKSLEMTGEMKDGDRDVGMEAMMLAGQIANITSSTRLLVNLRKLPVLNRRQVRGPRSGQAFLELKLRLAFARGEQKVWKAVAAEFAPPEKSVLLADRHGVDAAAFLETLGITDQGYSPRSVLLPPKDWYPSHELVSKIRGLSSLPSMNELKEQRRKGKVNAAGSLMLPAIEDHERFMASAAGRDKPAVAAARAAGKMRAAQAEARGLIYEVAREAFATIVGRAWFDEWRATPGEGKAEVEVAGKKVAAEVLLREIQVPV